MRTSIITAMGRNHVIGTATGLPWHLPRDLKLFRSLTTGKPVILGRKTLDQIGHPLPNRTNIVLTRQDGYEGSGILVAHSVAGALTLAHTEAARTGGDEVMVIGGGEVYRALLPFADRVYLTVVGGEFEGSATFPLAELDQLPFVVSSQQTYPPDSKNQFAQTYWQLDRLDSGSQRDVYEASLARRLGVA